MATSNTEHLFRVSSLSVEYDAVGGDVVRALHGVELEIAPGQSLGVLGESGSGKSSLALALMRLLPRNARIAGSIDYAGDGLASLNPEQLRQMRGGQVAFISQEPALALNPVLALGTQIKDVLKAHSNLDHAGLAARCSEILRKVGFEDPERIMLAYPHQLSGGQRQRVAIAQALVCHPRLLIADEPLSSLDAATQAEIVDLLQRLKRDLGLAIFFITHNAGVLWSLADQILVMRQGEVLARGAMEELQRSADPYVQGLLFPDKNIPASSAQTAAASAQPFLEVRRLTKSFVQRRLLSRKKFTVQSLDGVDLELRQGTTTAVLGRSGSGKSTLARCIAGFETPDSGEILLNGESRPPARRVQMVFQDPATSLNPRFSACQIVAEPLEIARWKTEADRSRRALELMEEVGLDPAAAARRAGEFSGGQRQRLALARSLAANPALLIMDEALSGLDVPLQAQMVRLLIMDEALSGLDVPLQAQMVRLLIELQSRHGLTYLYISHDLNFISLFAQEIVVMDAGRIVERLTPSELPRSRHPATRALLEASERLHAPGVEAAV